MKRIQNDSMQSYDTFIVQYFCKTT